MNYRTRLIGCRFGNLIVVGFSCLAKGRKTIWFCKCKCGQIKPVRNDCLVSGATTSCGCALHLTGKRHPSWKGYGEIGKSLWNTIKRDARKRSLPFAITIEYAWDLYLKQNRKCALTGEDIVFGKVKMDTLRTASLDRIDSKKGYIQGNVQWVTKSVNFAKQALGQDEFISLCNKVVKHVR